AAEEPIGFRLEGREQAMDRALEALYDAERRGDLAASSPTVARWLGDIREYFPSQVVRVMQQDALDRLGLKQMLFEKELLEVVEEMVGFGRKRSSLRDVVLCVDQSGSMAASVVYAGIFGAVLASIRSLTTRMVVFDTAVVDLTDEMRDPVDLLFAIQLGGGTD